jgi:hypothetical protein
VRQDLFKEGVAREVDDPALVRAALAHPEQVLRRPIGGKGPFRVTPQGLPSAPPPQRKGPRDPGRAARKPERPPPDRSELTLAEAALERLEERRRREVKRLEERRAEVDAAIAAAKSEHAAARKGARRALSDARSRYRKAGGTDV